MVSDPHFLWWALLFDGWLTTDAPNGYGRGRGNGYGRGNGDGYGRGNGDGYGYGSGYGGGYGGGRGRRTYGQ